MLVLANHLIKPCPSLGCVKERSAGLRVNAGNIPRDRNGSLIQYLVRFNGDIGKITGQLPRRLTLPRLLPENFLDLIRQRFPCTLAFLQ